MENTSGQLLLLAAQSKNVLIWNFSGPYFLTFGLTKEGYSVYLRILSKYREIRTEKLLIRTLFTQCLLPINYFHWNYQVRILNVIFASNPWIFEKLFWIFQEHTVFHDLIQPGRSFVVSRCTTYCYQLPFVITRCTTHCHS